MKQVKKLQLLTILAIIGCINNGYTELPVISHNITVNKQHVDKVINNKIIDVNKYNKQFIINEQLDNRINECCELINSINDDILKEKNATNKLKRELNLLKQSSTESQPKTILEQGRKLTEKLNDIDNVTTAKLSNLEYSAKQVEKYIDILKVLKNTSFFQKVVDFVQENSSKLLKGECIDFATVFKPLGAEINKSLDDIYGWAQNEEALEHKEIQEFLMYEALAMCPNLGITRVLEINNGKIECICGLINGIKTKDGRAYYGYSTGSTTYSIGLDLTNCF